MILQADALNMPLADCSVDAIVTDPPYGLGFMGKDWDNFKPSFIQEKMDADKRPKVQIASQRRSNTAGTYDMSLRGKVGFYEWMLQISKEMFRVLKPGGSLLVCGGTRTFHRLMCAIEDSGFIIKDTLMWIYGSGFPKAQDLGKMIDKRNGRNQEMYKPFAEYLKKKRKEKGLSMSEIDKRLETNTAYSWWEGRLSGIQLPTMEYYLKLKEILGLDGRFDKLIEREEAGREKIGKHQAGLGSGKTYAFTDDNIKANKEIDDTLASTDLAKYWDGFKVGGIKPAYEPIVWAVRPPEGSYVDNVLKHGVGAVNVDETRIESDKGDGVWGTSNKTIDPDRKFNASPDMHDYKSEQNPKGRFPANLILDEESAKVMDEQSGRSNHCRPSDTCDSKKTIWGSGKEAKKLRHKDNGGASRFFYCAKSSRTERNAGLGGMEEKDDTNHYLLASGFRTDSRSPKGGYENKPAPPGKNNHPTVKPIALFEWLIKLVTREGQIVLDPFLGSGTTAISAHNTGRKCIGIEKETEYIEIAKRRVDYHEAQPKQMEMRV